MEQQQLVIKRIKEDNYREFSKVLQWRGTGIKEEKSEEEIKKVLEFFNKHDIFKNDHFLLFAAELEGEYVGYIVASFLPKPDNRLGTFFVDELWVHEEYRGKNIAQALLDEVYNEGKRQGVWRVRLYVAEDNPAGRRAYAKNGFVEKGPCQFCERDI
ncbi:GNAT family N-acetyltransferase [Oceanirhabdus sp. W0125-5]|uniref:GNAT family N-acetyltransferase n=1 Tax=Oceanirhabdus sp. W0125-5 TaxID=2999116 RepID=UPI0022F33BDC|nr:GNAT family N-acetyltransferase [Oceanirhabdus sp. W0125-5]WBW96428.1 GNAT family N-acetyltransferase [Oceanirhabdus sp. W0125-5]